MIEWHHQLNGHKYEQTPGNSEAQRRLAYCSPWGCKESDTPEWINNNNWKSIHVSFLLRRKDAKLSIETGKIIMVIQKKSLIFPEDYQKVIFYSFPKNNSFIVKTEGKKKKANNLYYAQTIISFFNFQLHENRECLWGMFTITKIKIKNLLTFHFLKFYTYSHFHSSQFYGLLF